jgi:XTP/dITP diphosphohydrolase
MKTLLFATRNAHKVAELRLALQGRFHILSLDEAGLPVDIPEPHPTLEENAAEKSVFIHRLTGGDCFSEDTGLEVHALAGEPGARSARYAGEPSDDAGNRRLLLEKMHGVADRRARFKTVISLMLDGEEHRFTGICEGTITEEARGTLGFGYDPVFIPQGADRTFAEMHASEKNLYSHRRKATDRLVEFLSGRM